MTTGDYDTVTYSLLNEQGNANNQGEEEDVENGDGDDLYPVRTVTRSTSIGPSAMNSFAGRLRGSQRIAFLGILVMCFIIITWLLASMDGSRSSDNFNALLKSDGSAKASELKIDLDSSQVYKWHVENCYKTSQLGRSISDIHQKLQLLKVSPNEECRLIWEIFNSTFKIDRIEAPISLPKPFQEEVRGWLDNDEKLFEQVNNQVLFKVINKVTFEETVYNPIRAKRPVSKPSMDPLQYIKNLSDTTQPKCDFCNYKSHTAEDTFGRIDNSLSASCSNTFKLAKFHALFFPKQHYPLNLSLEHIEDIFLRTSKQWFEKAYETDSSQRYPSLLWDILPHAGASQVHPHIHGVLDAHQYVGGFESWHQIAMRYFYRTRRSFWSDFVKLHLALGLGLSKNGKYGNAVVILPLNAKKDNEYMILSPTLNKDFTNLVHKVMQTYENKLNVYCFSSGGVYPVMGDVDNARGMPVIFRFGSRGTCTAVGSDVSSLDLYTMNNINSDLAKTYDGLVGQI